MAVSGRLTPNPLFAVSTDVDKHSEHSEDHEAPALGSGSWVSLLEMEGKAVRAR